MLAGPQAGQKSAIPGHLPPQHGTVSQLNFGICRSERRDASTVAPVTDLTMAGILQRSKTEHKSLTCRFACGPGRGLAVSQARASTDAVPDVRPPDRMDGAAGTLDGIEGR
jgi:hypothetical protein